MTHFVYSFIVDTHPKFAYQGWQLARSLCCFCHADPGDIHVQLTAEVPAYVRELFENEGYATHTLERFGDGRWCNKLSQLPNLKNVDFDFAVLLDTDTIAVADVRPFFEGEYLQAKVVDLANPSLQALDEIFAKAGGTDAKLVSVDTSEAETYLGNANGGLYAVPKSIAEQFSEEWRRWALWLLEHSEPLKREGKAMHVDQVSVMLAVQCSGIPFEPAPSNVNYFVHMSAEHRYMDPTGPIALLHYHDMSLNVLGLIEPPIKLNPLEQLAVSKANQLISTGFQNRLFWDFRYAVHPERGSGVGSRGANAEIKRTILRTEGVESAASILDVGCGDLEVLRGFSFEDYVGIDVSSQAIETARAARPDLTFELVTKQGFEPRDWVLCLEVLIHQTNAEDYQRLIDFITSHARKTLIVSGYDQKAPHHMCYFFEPLYESLQNTNRFSSIRNVGQHSDVVVYRCDV